MIYPDDNISGSVVEKLKTELAPYYTYEDANFRTVGANPGGSSPRQPLRRRLCLPARHYYAPRPTQPQHAVVPPKWKTRISSWQYWERYRPKMTRETLL